MAVGTTPCGQALRPERWPPMPTGQPDDLSVGRGALGSLSISHGLAVAVTASLKVGAGSPPPRQAATQIRLSFP